MSNRTEPFANIGKLERVRAMHDLPSEMKSGTPRISIGLVVYNGAEYIRSALDSIVKQPYKDIELVVVDGGSSDGTLDVLEEFANYISVMVSKPDEGIYDAMNKVCSLATGDWLIFLGCDDVLLEALGDISVQMTSPDSVYYGDAIFLSSGNVIGGRFSKRRLAQMNICHQAVFYPRTVYKKYAYSLDYSWLADYAYNLNLVGIGIQFVYVNEVVSVYNDKGGSSHGDAEFEKKKIKLIYSSLGLMYVALEILRRLKVRLIDITARSIGVFLKCLLPYSYWKYFQSLWRRMQKYF